jgi:hypothetical protein
MHLDVAKSAIPETGTSKIMERRRNGSERAGWLCLSVYRAYIAVALQALQLHFMACQHSRIRGTMRLVTPGTPVSPDRHVLESERTPLIAVTLETAGLVGGDREGLYAVRHGAVRVMAVDTSHRTFWEPVGMGPLELCPNIRVTTDTLRHFHLLRL